MPAAGEISQQLRVWAALPKDPSLALSTHVGQITTACNSSSRETDTGTWTQVYKPFRRHTQTIIKNIKKKNKDRSRDEEKWSNLKEKQVAILNNIGLIWNEEISKIIK